MSILKKALAALAIMAVLVGCTTKNDYQGDTGTNTVIFAAGFNEEQYVWEAFLFPTNRTER